AVPSRGSSGQGRSRPPSSRIPDAEFGTSAGERLYVVPPKPPFAGERAYRRRQSRPYTCSVTTTTTLTFHALDQADPTVAGLIRKEYQRQSQTLELIPSENLASPAILEALGTLLTNKYSEGYPGRRYYGGCEVMDEIETLAQERARQLFGVAYVN